MTRGPNAASHEQSELDGPRAVAPPASDSSSFERRITQECTKARVRQTLSAALSGAAFSALIATLFEAGSWLAAAASAPRALALALIALGSATSALVAWMRGPRLSEHLLKFDRRLGTLEVLSAAWEAPTESAFSGALRARALRLLDQAQAAHLPRVWRKRHWSIPLLVASAVTLALIPVASVPLPMPLAGAKTVRWQHLEDLAAPLGRINLASLGEPERQHLRDLVARITALQSELSLGLPEASLQSELNRLQDTLSAELKPFTDDAESLHAAVAALSYEPLTERAARALERGDLKAFDDEMRRLSSAEERSARAKARQVLSEAQAKARQSRAGSVSRILGEEETLFETRAQLAERIRELITQLGSEAAPPAPSAARASEARPMSGSRNAEPANTVVDEDRRKLRGLAARLNRALLGDEQDYAPPSNAELEALSRTSSPEVSQELTQALQRYGEPSPSAERHQAMWDTSRAISRLQRALGGNSLPLRDADTSARTRSQPSPGPSSAAAPRSPGNNGSHAGSTPASEAKGLQALAQANLNAGIFRGSSGESFTESPLGTRPLPGRFSAAAAANEIQGVERPAIPREYQEQLSRYFAAE